MILTQREMNVVIVALDGRGHALEEQIFEKSMVAYDHMPEIEGTRKFLQNEKFQAEKVLHELTKLVDANTEGNDYEIT